MFALSSSLNYYMYSEAADMRKGFDSLCGLIHTGLQGNPLSGDVFIFINKRRDSVKLLRWDDTGFILYYKRLEKGTFEIPLMKEGDGSCRLQWSQLVMMIEGISFKDVRHRKRFSFAGNC